MHRAYIVRAKRFGCLCDSYTDTWFYTAFHTVQEQPRENRQHANHLNSVTSVGFVSKESCATPRNINWILLVKKSISKIYPLMQ